MKPLKAGENNVSSTTVVAMVHSTPIYKYITYYCIIYGRFKYDNCTYKMTVDIS